jgi:hypothetical protein
MVRLRPVLRLRQVQGLQREPAVLAEVNAEVLHLALEDLELLLLGDHGLRLNGQRALQRPALRFHLAETPFTFVSTTHASLA